MTNNNSAIDSLRGQLASKSTEAALLNYLGQDEVRLRKMQAAVITSVHKVPELLNCDPNSMMQAVIACAELNLYPSAISGEAFILPYRGKAQFLLGYQGLITLMYAAGVDAVNTQIVYKNEKFRYEEGLISVLEHTPTPFGEKKGEAIGVYAIADLNGARVFKVMSKDEIMEVKKLSAARDSKFSPWNGNDPQLWMWRKTCLKQLAKILPKNERLQTAISRDNEESIFAAPARRSINAAALKKGAPTISTMTQEHHDTKQLTDKEIEEEGEKAADLFGVADNNPDEPIIEA